MRWTFVIPYFNEEAYLPATLASLAAQTVPFHLVLVDNGSTDASPAIAHAFSAPHVTVTHLTVATPGKVYALAAADAAIATELVAFGDADTWYPPDYLARATRAYTDPHVVAAMAMDVPAPDARWRRWWRSGVIARVLRNQTHTGGYGQTFRTVAYRAAGGYSPVRWLHVLEDHEIMQRVLKRGRVVYPVDLWCIPSTRRANREAVQWTLGEQALYHLTPFALKDRFFAWLGRRFAARGVRHTNLREKNW